MLTVSKISLLLLLLFTGSFAIAQELNQAPRRQLLKELREAEALFDVNPDSAISMVKSLNEVVHERQDNWQVGLTKQSLGHLFRRKREYIKAYVNYYDAFRYLESSDTVDLFYLGSVTSQMGLIQYRFDNFGESIILRKRALSYWGACWGKYGARYENTTAMLPNYMAETKHYLANCYLKVDSVKEGMDLLKTIYLEAKQRNDFKRMGKAINGLGVAYDDSQLLDSAEYFFRKLLNDSIPKKYLGIAHHNLAELYHKQGILDSAILSTKKALVLNRQYNTERWVFLSQTLLADLLYESGEYKTALTMWQKAVALYDKVDSPELFIVYDDMSKAASLTGDTNLSEAYAGIYRSRKEKYELSDDIISNTERRAAFLNFLKDLEKRDLESKLKRDYTSLTIAISIFCTVVAIMIFIVLRRRKRKKLYDELGNILFDE